MTRFWTHANRRALLAGALALAAGAACAAYPDRPVTLVAPYPAGGAADVLARLLAKQLEAQLGKPVIVDNKPGAGTAIGAAAVANAKPDGYTLLISSNSTFTLNPAAGAKTSYDPAKSFEAIGMVGTLPLAVLVNPAVPAQNVQQLVAAIKADPDKFPYGSFGNATSSHYAGAMFNQATGLKMLHVPYKGSAPLMTDLIGGQVPVSFDTVVAAAPQAKAGKIKVLAVTTAKRSPALPDVPTLQEAGLKDFDIGTWFGVLAPVGTPKPVLDRLSAEATKIIQSPDFRKRMDDIGAQPVGNSPAEMAAQIRSETDKFSVLVKAGNVTVE